MFVDSHAHLDMEPFDSDREDVIRRAREAKVSFILNVGSGLESSRKACELARSYPFIRATVGIHPHDAEKVEDSHMAALKVLARAPEVVAIGETGLDYFKDYSHRDAQKELFRGHIRLAREVGKPLVIHARDAWDDLFSIIEEEKANEAGGVIHCFSGSPEIALKCVDLGFYISFAGPLTFPKAEELRLAAKAVPSRRLLTETDSPFLAPKSRRGKRNEPALVVEVAERLARLKGIAPRDLSRVILKNIYDLFGVGEPGSRKIVYQIRNSLYLNVTNRCTNRCRFCDRIINPVVTGYDIRMDKEPTAAEAVSLIGDPGRFDEVVFCGYGEPLLRLDFVKDVAGWIKDHGGRVRVNTNGHGNLIHKKNVLPELKGLVDEVSVSLNAETKERYDSLCVPEIGGAYEGVKEFIREAGKWIPDVTVTVVRVPGRVDVAECEKIAGELGGNFRVREYNVVG